MKDVKTVVRVLAALLVGTVATGMAQEVGDRSVEGRLLEILRKRGIITDAEFGELSRLEEEIRHESELESKLEGRIDEMVNRIAQEGPKTGYKVGKGFNWTTPDGKFALTLGGRMQVRVSHEENDNNTAAGKFDEGETNINVPRMRVWLEGHAFEPYWKYNVQFDVAGDTARGPVSVAGGAPAVTSTGTFTSQNRLTELKDAWIEFTKWAPFNIRGGQFKVPYSRHQITSSGKLEFVDRTVTDSVFAPGRNHGVMVFGSTGGEKSDIFEYYAGAFNGEGENSVNNDDGLMWAGRLAVNPLGGIPYSESDLKGTEDFRIALGVNSWFHDNDNHNQAGARFDTWTLGADLTMTWMGFFFTAEAHTLETEQGGADLDAEGWFAQLGYFIIPHELEIAVRAAGIDWDDSATVAGQREYLGVLGWFLADHNLKFQLDFGRVELHQHNHANNDDEWRGRLQAQIIF